MVIALDLKIFIHSEANLESKKRTEKRTENILNIYIRCCVNLQRNVRTKGYIYIKKTNKQLVTTGESIHIIIILK